MNYLEVAGLILTLVLAWSGFLIAVIRFILERYLKQFDDRWATLQNTAEKGMSEYLRIDREIMELRAALPQQYVRREDFLRMAGVFEAKLDRLSSDVRVLTITVESTRAH